MPRWTAALALFATPTVFTAPLASTGCAVCDCLMDSIEVRVQDEAGAASPVDEVRVTGPDGQETSDTCDDSMDCSWWFMPVSMEGPHTVTVLVDGLEVGSTEVMVEKSRKGCCRGGMYADTVLEIGAEL